tara:strand:- start:218 stop:628 length:411 start_codon:yes stop_codon:yes gene_type:complete
MIAIKEKPHKQRLRLSTRDIDIFTWSWYKWGDLVDGTTREYNACYTKWIKKFQQCALDMKAVYAKYDMKPPTSLRHMVMPKERCIYLEPSEYRIDTEGNYILEEYDKDRLLDMSVSQEAYKSFCKKKPNGHYYYEI